jgi:hypothetical protein
MSGSRPLDATLFIPSELQARPPARELEQNFRAKQRFTCRRLPQQWAARLACRHLRQLVDLAKTAIKAKT